MIILLGHAVGPTHTPWLGLNWDEDIILQSKNNSRHQEIVSRMLKDGAAYKCFLQKDELDKLRRESEKKKEVFRVPRTYRDLPVEKEKELIKEGKSFTVRIKVPDGETEFNDLVYGSIKVQNKDLDDFIIARSDGSPTYNFVVAVDDADMKITHVVRGDDHLANTPKQIQIVNALGYKGFEYVHLPLVLGEDRKRLSKRSELLLPGFWPTYYKKAKGCKVWDLDDKVYYDFAGMGVTACVLGYSNDYLNKKLFNGLKTGSMCTLNAIEEIDLANELLKIHKLSLIHI